MDTSPPLVQSALSNCYTHGYLRLLTALAAAILATACTGDEEPRFGVWQTEQTPEGDSTIWSAVHPHGEVGIFKFSCQEGVLAFVAQPDDPFDRNLGHGADEMDTAIAIDSLPVVEMKGLATNFPVFAVEDREVAEMRRIIDTMAGGNETKIRTTSGGKQHIFTLSMDGFREASAWVLERCGEGEQP